MPFRASRPWVQPTEQTPRPACPDYVGWQQKQAQPDLSDPSCSCTWALLHRGQACVRGSDSGSACARRCCEPPADSRTTSRLAVVVQVSYVVSDALLMRLRRARDELPRTDALFVAYVVGDGKSDRCPNGSAVPIDELTGGGLSNLRRLQAAVGDEAVWCLDPVRRCSSLTLHLLLTRSGRVVLV